MSAPRDETAKAARSWLGEARELGLGLAARLVAGVAPGLAPDVPRTDLAGLRVVAERRRAEGLDTDPAAAHPRPPWLAKAEVESVDWPGGGGAERLTGASEFVPFDPELETGPAAPAEAPDRDRFEAWLLRRPASSASGLPRPALIAVAGSGRAGPRALDRLFAPRQLDRLGLDVALLPFPLVAGGAAARGLHGGALSADPLRATADLARAVWDLRRLAGWLRAAGAPAVGIVGVGPGATAAALLAGLDPRLASVVLDRPLVSPVEACRRAWPARPATSAWNALEPGLLESVLAPVSPLRMLPRVSQEARLLLGFAGDRAVTPEDTRALQRHWQLPAVEWRSPGPFLPRAGAVRERIEAHLVATLCTAAGEARLLTRFRPRPHDRTR